MDAMNKLINVDTLLDENLEIAENTLSQLEIQEEQLNNAEYSILNIEYYSKKSKDILKRMGSFFKRVWYRPVEIDVTREYDHIQMDEIDKEVKNFEDKLSCLKTVGLKIGETLDKQNVLLENLDYNVDKNKSFIDKNNTKINRLL
jgi:hypothetical protein